MRDYIPHNLPRWRVTEATTLAQVLYAMHDASVARLFDRPSQPIEVFRAFAYQVYRPEDVAQRVAEQMGAHLTPLWMGARIKAEQLLKLLDNDPPQLSHVVFTAYAPYVPFLIALEAHYLGIDPYHVWIQAAMEVTA